MEHPNFFYKSKRWEKKREKILRRDGYMCQEAKRYGKAVEATTVHHAWPLEEYPEYAWADWNLVSLSAKAHDEMHDRRTGKLTGKGLAMKERAGKRRPGGPPPPERMRKKAAGDRCGEAFPTAEGFE